MNKSEISNKEKVNKQKNLSLDWLIGGVLTKIGEIFDRLTGRKWKPSSSLATSELILRLKTLLDTEVRDLDNKGKFVPHNIKLKMQWNKFSTDAEDSIKKLEYELLAAAIDHINDNRYHTYKPLSIEIKPDYFTEGIKFLASFGELDTEEAEINIAVPQMNESSLNNEQPEEEGEVFIAEFDIKNKPSSTVLKFSEGKRITVGRTKENNLSLEDPSVSKVHATLMLNEENQLVVADTGSTNGTFINNQRIAYGRAFPVGEGDKLKFGTVDVFLRRNPQTADFETSKAYEMQDSPPERQELLQPQLKSGEADKAVNDFSTQIDPIDKFDKTLAMRDFEDAEEVERFQKETQNRVLLNFDKD